MAAFYEIKSSRERHSGALVKRSFQCAEVPGVTVFVWQHPRAGGSGVAPGPADVDQVQLLFGEEFVEWRSGVGVSSGRLYREQEQGVRSLQAGEPCDLDAARSLLTLHTFPDDVVAPLRALLG